MQVQIAKKKVVASISRVLQRRFRFHIIIRSNSTNNNVKIMCNLPK